MYDPKQKGLSYRLLECMPATFVWTTLLGTIALSFVRPLWAILFIIVFDLFWVFRVFYFVFYITVSWLRYRRTIKRDWLTEVRKQRGWERILHAVVLPFYTEPEAVIRTTLESFLAAAYPHKKLLIVLSAEARAGDSAQKILKAITKSYGDKFGGFIATTHPDGLEGEIKAKGANAHWAGHRLKEYIDAQHIPYKDVVVSYFDVDTTVHQQYFANLAYTYLTHPNPLRTSYQPVALYNNNIWEASPVTRVAAFGTTFWLLTELARPERLFTFSSHAMSFQALVDVGFWQKDIVTDDSRIFLQGFFRYDGAYTVTPLYIPVSMDAVIGEGIGESMKNLYKQQRRWAYGIEHFPYMMKNFLGNNRISRRKKIHHLWNLSEGMYSWATAPIIITVIGRLPLWVGRDSFAHSAIFQSAPYVLEKLMTIAMVGIFVSIGLSLLLLPPRPKHTSWLTWPIMAAQWIMLPITLIIFGSVPALDAQTRLFLGKYLGFFNTPKQRNTS